MTLLSSVISLDTQVSSVESLGGDNPFLAMLPPIRDTTEAVHLMQRLVIATSEDRALPVHHRLDRLENIAGFVQPLSPHVELFHTVSRLLRRGYDHRNPNKPGVIQMLNAIPDVCQGGYSSRVVSLPMRTSSAGKGATLLGQSGVGKTTAINVILESYPQVIAHTGLSGPLADVLQIVWLKISCPPDGSLKGLCMDFFRAIDDLCGTSYFEIYGVRKTTDQMRIGMARVAVIHGLGVLVIDELQNLSASKSGNSIPVMMNFFKLLRNELKVPTVLVGTKEAERIVGGDSQLARRHAGEPDWKPMQMGPEFDLFCSSLFDAQFTAEPIDLNPDLPSAREWLALIHELSQGIVAVVVKLFMLAQARVLSSGREQLTPQDFSATYEDSFSLLHPFLDRMRAGFQADDTDFDLALRATYRQRASAQVPILRTRDEIARTAQAPSPRQTPSSQGTSASNSRKPKRSRAASRCVLVATAHDGANNGLTSHQAMLAAGFVRRLGSEAMAA